jgi:hypothetical protein
MERKESAIKVYRKILKEEGVKGFIEKVGWKVAVLLFMFFLIKGLVWLFIFYGGVELIKALLR